MKQIDLQGNVYDIGIEDDFDKTMKDIKEHLIDRIKRQEKEIERLNNAINKFSEELGKEMNKIVALGTISQKQVAMNVLDKLKELNGNKRK